MIALEDQVHLQAADLGPVRDFLQNALKMKSRGETHHYNHLLRQLRQRDDPETLWRVYLGLTSCVGSVTQRPDEFSELIQSLFAYDWKLEKRINVALINLLGHLVSANSIFLIPTLQMVLKALSSLSTSLLTDSEGSSEQAPSSANSILHKGDSTNDELTSMLHNTLRHCVSSVPTGLVELMPVAISNFPYRKRPLECITNYIYQLLRLCDYLPVLQPKMLELIIERCLEIDVEIWIEDTGEVCIKPVENELEDSMDGGIFKIDELHTVETHATPFRETSLQIASDVAEMAEKLDAMLILLIEYVDRQLVLGDEQGDRLFCHIIAIFEDKILLAHRSKFVQVRHSTYLLLTKHCHIFS